jgi:hypothetical protein
LCVGLGLNELAVAAMTETEPRDDSVIPDVGQRVSRAVKGGARSAKRATRAS